MLTWDRSSLTGPLLEAKIKRTTAQKAGWLLRKKSIVPVSPRRKPHMQLGILHWRQVLSWLISILRDSWMQTPVCSSFLEIAIARHLQQSLGWAAMAAIFEARQCHSAQKLLRVPLCHPCTSSEEPCKKGPGITEGKWFIQTETYHLAYHSAPGLFCSPRGTSWALVLSW